ETEASSLTGELRQALLRQLPDYMVPSAFVLLDKLPLTVHGKLDKQALPVPQETSFARESYVAPEGEVEEQMAELWSALLGIGQVGRHDDFFALGGHSLRAIRLINLVQQHFAVHIELSRLFRHSTLTDFSRQVLLAVLTNEFNSDELNELVSTRGENNE
ncbi:phosphopantetheine-binding protein, partial [Xenorhabdus khoisanae]|uniref:phosphopantetheine-binding protein n=1 Tax=Xenorhabdus khoisanae TaxID=880157 RepID=UPI00235A0059